VTAKLQLDEPAEGVARLTISNPERRGALDHEILDALAGHARTLDARCLVIRGSGDVFSAGYDIGNLSEHDSFEESAEKLVAHPFHDAIEAVEAYRYPVIAELNGHAIGGGLELALTADIRVAAHGVKLGMPPAKLGLIYSHTGLAKFIDVCGPANTAELFFVGRNVDAERAREMGLVNQVVDPVALGERVVDLAAEIASNAPLSLAGNKRMLRELRALRLPPELERELVELRESCFASDDFREGVQAFAEKRKPVWRGR
jgi:enoyl-CoA hydratase/carnithine racemase